ncbi:hypothetical protein [Brevibacillus brevis]|uniref:hypothetical protein n=1 Tax=Brevibacillus brevis TaxID=1393 RepID=UPI0007D8B5F5|nr:hypothetical protein [Brevibacillus brevis]
MAYEKPRCDCGEELFHFDQVVYSEERGIRRDGKLKAKVLFRGIEGSYSAHGAFLYCNHCRNQYDYDFDEKDRIIRDELRR